MKALAHIDPMPTAAVVRIHLTPAKLIRILVAFAIFLIIATVISNLLTYHYGHDFGLWRFNLDRKGAVATWFKTTGLLLSAFLLYIIAFLERRSHNPFAPQWLGLAVIFTYLSMDEASQIHQWFDYVLRPDLHITRGPFYFAWIIPYGVLSTICLIYYLRFLKALPKPDMKRFILSAVVSVGGAAGMEAIDGWYASLHGGEGHLSALCTLYYGYQTTIEEGLEAFGIILFIYTLLTYLQSHWPKFTVSVSDLPEWED